MRITGIAARYGEVTDPLPRWDIADDGQRVRIADRRVRYEQDCFSNCDWSTSTLVLCGDECYLASVESGDLRLWHDPIGLHVEATVDDETAALERIRPGQYTLGVRCEFDDDSAEERGGVLVIRKVLRVEEVGLCRRPFQANRRRKCGGGRCR